MNKLLTTIILVLLGSESIAQNTSSTTTQNNAGYLMGAIISLMILCYLLYTLFKPEKF